jgi:hypothetical protein
MIHEKNRNARKEFVEKFAIGSLPSGSQFVGTTCHEYAMRHSRSKAWPIQLTTWKHSPLAMGITQVGITTIHHVPKQKPLTLEAKCMSTPKFMVETHR